MQNCKVFIFIKFRNYSLLSVKLRKYGYKFQYPLDKISTLRTNCSIVTTLTIGTVFTCAYVIHRNRAWYPQSAHPHPIYLIRIVKIEIFSFAYFYGMKVDSFVEKIKPPKKAYIYTSLWISMNVKALSLFLSNII